MKIGFLCFIYFIPYFIGLGPKPGKLRTGEGKYTKTQKGALQRSHRIKVRIPFSPFQIQPVLEMVPFRFFVKTAAIPQSIAGVIEGAASHPVPRKPAAVFVFLEKSEHLISPVPFLFSF